MAVQEIIARLHRFLQSRHRLGHDAVAQLREALEHLAWQWDGNEVAISSDNGGVGSNRKAVGDPPSSTSSKSSFESL